MDQFLQGFGIVFGVVAGVVAGTAVTLFTQWVQNKYREDQTVKNLKFECNLNIQKIDKWLEKIGEYRNAVNGDTVESYYGYFDLGKAVSSTADAMFLSGLLYKYLENDEIGQLQTIFTEFSLNGESIINQEIAGNKAKPDKKAAVKTIDFWERKFKKHKKTFEELEKKLEQ